MYSPEEIERKRLSALLKKGHKTYPNTPSVEPITPVKRRLESYSSVPRENKQPRLNTIKVDKFFGKTNQIKANLAMISADRFQVNVPYHEGLIKLFHAMPSKKYDPKTKLWNFHLDDYNKLLHEIAVSFDSLFAVTSIPAPVIQTFRANLKKNHKPEPPDLEEKIEKKLISTLMPFQREGISFGIQKNGNCIIADDMGLGKTIQALGIAHYFRDDWPLLIISPSSVRYQWSEAIFQYLPSIPAQHVLQFSSGKDFLGSEKVTVVSYDLLVRYIQMFERKVFGFIIIDESHTLKSFKTERTKSVQKLASQARHVLLLSGTPALSRPIELYSQISLVCRNFMKMQVYGVRYCDGQKGAYGWDFKGSSNVEELQLLLKSTCLIRRLKSDVLKQLPDKIRQVVILDPGLIKAATKEMERMAAELQGTSLKGALRHSALLQYYAESSKQKVLAAANYVKDLVEKGMKFIVFAHHACMLEKICEILEKCKVQYIKIDGKTKADDRKSYVDKFQQSESCLVAVLSITAANAGITLTAASFVVFAELYWNPGTLSQAEDRVHRIGQDKGVVIQYLIAKGSVDDFLWPLLQSKTRFLTSAGLDQNFSFSEASLLTQKLSGEDLALSESMDKQGTLDDFGFSQEFASDFEERLSGKVETATSDEESAKKTDENGKDLSETLSQFMDEDDDDFADINLENIP